MRTHIYYIAVIVALLALGLWGGRVNRGVLAERDARIAGLQSDLTLCRADVKGQDSALAGLRGQNSAGQDNCAAALAAMSLVSEISRLTPSNPRHTGGTANIPPAVPPANTLTPGKATYNDAAFTDFLNTF